MIKSIECPYVISKLPEHELIKQDILDIINKSESNRYIYPEDYTDITRTDWDVDRSIEREYTQILFPPLDKFLHDRADKLGYDSYSIRNIWFQQYNRGSKHGWHVHFNCQFTNVYYLDMPEGSPKTQLLNPMNQEEIIELDVKEGDVLTFPSFILHRAPKVDSDVVKTIISWNSDFNLTKVKGLYDF